jgi:hypothetical protein
VYHTPSYTAVAEVFGGGHILRRRSELYVVAVALGRRVSVEECGDCAVEGGSSVRGRRDSLAPAFNASVTWGRGGLV